MVKLSGADFKRFYADKAYWPDSAWHEDVIFYVDRVKTPEDFDMGKVADTALVWVEGGFVVGIPAAKNDYVDMEKHTKAWLEEQSNVLLVVECDKAKRAELEALLKASGYKIKL